MRPTTAHIVAYKLAAMTRAGKAKIQLIYKYLIGWDKKLKHSKNHSDSISNNKVITSNQI